MMNAKIQRTGRTARAIFAVLIVGVLMVSLLVMRQRLNEEEKRATYIMSSLSWKVSETLLQSQKLITVFAEFEQDATPREEVIIANELLWSRADILLHSELNHHSGLTQAGKALRSFLEDNEEAIYDAPVLTVAEVARIRSELANLAEQMRATWIKDFLGSRQTLHATATQDLTNARVLFERLIIACVLLLALYMLAEILGAQKSEVRESKLRNQALSASRAKTEFLANFSHEIRTPLNAVIGMAQELVETAQTKEQNQLTKVILSSADVLLGTINDVLDISTLESGRLALGKVTFDPVACLKTTLKSFDEEVARKGLALYADLDHVPKIAVIGDASRYTQVIQKLMSNAVKFTDHGAVTVGISLLEDHVTNRCEISVKIRDTGPGIAAEKSRALFQPFDQGDTSTTRSTGGTGLGLPIARAICREMNGDVRLSSDPFSGSTFTATFLLPMADATAELSPTLPASLVASMPLPDDDAAQAANAADDATVADPSTCKPCNDIGLKILLTDDSATNRMVMKRLLKSSNAEIDEAASGHEAVHLASENAYDLILMDIQMPGMDGIEATSKIRAMEASSCTSSRVPIIAVTANVMSHQVASYLDNGMDKVVAKPVRKAEILGVIDHLKNNQAA